MERQVLLCLYLSSVPGLIASGLINQPRSIGIINGIEIQSMKVNCRITSRFAHYVITSQAINHGNTSQEIVFDVEIPKTAYISNFLITVDGVPYPGNIEDKAIAWKQYRKAIIKGETAGLVRASGRKMEKFNIAVNIGAGSKVSFELTYEELLKRHLGKYEIVIKVKPKQLVRQFEIEADIFEPQEISMLDAQATFLSRDMTQFIEKSFSGKKGRVYFNPTIDQQQACPTCTKSLLDGDFKIKYDVKRDTVCDLQVVNKHFAQFFAPKNLKNMSKNVVFVIDISGSMAGQKIRQTREALLKILADIKLEDYFNLILFGSHVKAWKNSLVQATVANLQEARDFVQTFHLAGATNLNGGLLEGIKTLNEALEADPRLRNNAPIVIMLTDGEPTVGETNLDQIRMNVKNAIQGKFPLYNLGFGENVDFSFLEAMSLENNGAARRIYAENDAAEQLQGFYDEVANPLLTDVEFQYPKDSIQALTENRVKQFYEGSEIVVAGKLSDGGLKDFKADVTGRGAGQNLVTTCLVDEEETEKILRERGHLFEEHIERLWAYLTIQQLLEKWTKANSEKEKNDLSAKVVELARKYKFVTPLTSMVITKPGDPDDRIAIADKPGDQSKQKLWVLPAQQDPLTSHLRPRPRPHPHPQGPPDHVTGVDGDPHFIIQVPEKDDAICFNINEEPGVVLSLIQDPDTGIIVNGQLIGDKNHSNGKNKNTYFGRLGIMNQKMGFTLEVTPQNITLRPGMKGSVFSWMDQVTLRQGGVTVTILPTRKLVVSMDNGATMVVVLHHVWKKHPVHQDFLGIYTVDSHKMSPRTHGLLGQFFHSFDFEVFDVRPGSDPNKPEATMLVKNHRLKVTRGSQKDYRKDPWLGSDVSCWFVHDNGAGLIDGTHMDYVIPSIF
ncbi:inter-alpha-trypsin inhibitor heavy chain H1 isoform X2 [Monodelphis domestica]|uniref:inter-alpha-trypsin inhibitor heavy chain H1 isoform X2 n=1 Tax=Monodelphis domestica TaxID=13616 RepID=UPI0024E22C0F|nr:inter-alpha-trypsin inhibitor heavy chain H1 isoform X2 [Monodelphis domestica]